MIKKLLPVITISIIICSVPLFAEIKRGSSIKCKKEGSSRYTNGKVLWSNNRLVGVQFNDGDRKTVNKSRCRLNSTRPTTTTDHSTSSNTGKFKAGNKVECNWKGRGKFYPGKITRISRGRLYIRYDDNDTEKTTPERCRLKGGQTDRPTTTTTNNTNENRRRPVNTNNQDNNQGGAKTMFNYFSEANRRLRRHPSDSSLKMDRAVAGKYTRIEVGPRRSYSVILSHVQFLTNGTGSMLRETFKLTTRKQLVVDSRKNVRLNFRWGVELHKTSSGQPVTLIRMKFGNSGFRFYYALEPGKSMGSLFFNESTQRPGKQVLFAEQGQFIRDWNRKNHEIMRKALADAHAIDQEIELRSLMNRNLQMGNNNMLMLNTMNMGFR